MATPIRSDIREVFKAMRDAVVDFLLIRICFVVCFADTLGDDLRVAFGVASVLAISTLHACRVLQEIST